MTETKRWNHGGILVEFREDGSLHIYAPDDSRVLGRDLAEELAVFLLDEIAPVRWIEGAGLMQVEGDFGPVPPPVDVNGILASLPPELDESGDSRWGTANTLPALTDTEIEADKNAAEARADIAAQQETVPSGEITTRRRPTGEQSSQSQQSGSTRRAGRPRRDAS